MTTKLAALLTLATLLMTPVAAHSMPHVELSVQYRPVPGAPNSVRLAATNFGPGNAYVMSYQTAFALPQGRTTGRWIDVRERSGTEVAYTGRWVLTRSPGPSSYRRIAVGETITVDVDLAAEYALPKEGEITVSSSIDVMDRLPGLDAMGESENVPHELVDSGTIAFPVLNFFHDADSMDPAGQRQIYRSNL